MELQDIGVWLVVLVVMAFAAFGAGENLALIIGAFLNWIFGVKPVDLTVPSARRSKGIVRTAFEHDEETAQMRGKITAQGEIWNAVWVDSTTAPLPVDSEVEIIELEGLLAHVKAPAP